MTTVDRGRLPQVGAAAPFRFPSPRRTRLESGVRCWSIEHSGVPVVSALLLLPAGSALDPPEQAGLAALTADLLDEGTGSRSAIGVHEELARLGTVLETEVGPDATVVVLTTLTRFLGPALALLADIVLRPRLAADDFTRVRDLRLNRLRQLRDVPSSVADRAFARVLYGSHPYGHLAGGSEEGLASTTRTDAAEFHARWYWPDRLTLIIVGAAAHDEMVSAAAAAFGAVPSLEERLAPAGDDPDAHAFVSGPLPADGPRLTVVDRPGAPQSELRVGHLGAARSEPDYHAIVVMNMLLGGQFVSRLNMNLREKRGYTYGVRSAFDFRVSRGPFQVQGSVQSNATAAAVREIFGEVDELRGARPATEAELALARAGITLGYPRNFETAEQIARATMQLALYDLEDDYYTTFVPRVAAVDSVEITRVAAAHLHPERLRAVIVGDRARIAPELETLGFGEPDVVQP
jgi:predicted Zn-dependent peptidase